jgi:hypothetical protein
VDEKGEKIIFFNHICMNNAWLNSLLENMNNEKINSLDEFEKWIRNNSWFYFEGNKEIVLNKIHEYHEEFLQEQRDFESRIQDEQKEID